MNEEAFSYALKDLDISEIETEVLRLICQGFTNERIAIIRSTSITAVEKMSRKLRRVLEVETKGRLAGREKVNPRVSLINRVWEIAWANLTLEVERG